jgi:hypothetical protein
MIRRSYLDVKILGRKGPAQKRVAVGNFGYAVPAICLTRLHQAKKRKRKITKAVSQSGSERFRANLTVPIQVPEPTLRRNTTDGAVLVRKASADFRNPRRRLRNQIQGLSSVQELLLPQHYTND